MIICVYALQAFERVFERIQSRFCHLRRRHFSALYRYHWWLMS